MPAAKAKSQQSVQVDTLLALQKAGYDSTVLECRLVYGETVQTLGQVRSVMGQERVHPSYLPTQASGRWSTTNPPIVNWSQDMQDIIRPDPEWYWLAFDWDAVEARLIALLCGDEEDIAAFNNNWDLHTLTACRTWGLPLPPDPTKGCHESSECVEWRASIGWVGDKDRRRHLAKTLRYGCNYGPDEYAVLNAKGVEELGLERDQLLDAARLYLKSKVKLQEWKRREWAACYQTREARTFLGRRRRLFPTADEIRRWQATGAPGESAREGLNHEVQGGIADAMNMAVIAIKQRWPMCRLVLQAHDGLKLAFPEKVNPYPAIREEAEREWTVNGRSIRFTAAWERINSDGSKVSPG